MTWQDALDVLADHNAHARFCQLCADSYPGVSTKLRDQWRRRVVEMAAAPSVTSDLARVDAAYAEHGTGPRRTGGCGHPC